MKLAAITPQSDINLRANFDHPSQRKPSCLRVRYVATKRRKSQRQRRHLQRVPQRPKAACHRSKYQVARARQSVLSSPAAGAGDAATALPSSFRRLNEKCSTKLRGLLSEPGIRRARFGLLRLPSVWIRAVAGVKAATNRRLRNTAHFPQLHALKMDVCLYCSPRVFRLFFSR